jgi:hypothetical protein
MGMLGPGSEVRGGVAVAVEGQAAAVAAEDPLDQLHLLLDRAAPGAGLGGGEPTVADNQFSSEPCRLAAQLASQLTPGGVADSAGQTVVGHEVGDGKVLQTRPGRSHA